MALSTRIAVMKSGPGDSGGHAVRIYEFPQRPVRADFIGTTICSRARCAAARPARRRDRNLVVKLSEAGCDLIVDEIRTVQQRPAGFGLRCVRKDPLSKQKVPPAGSASPSIKSRVPSGNSGISANRSTYRIRLKPAGGHGLCQNERRTLNGHRLSDEVYLSWSTDGAVC